MFAEVSLGVFDLGPVYEAEVPDAAVSEAVDDGPSEPFREVVVNECAAVCPDSGKTTTRTMFRLSSAMAFQAAGGTTTSEGKGTKELSMAMKRVTTQ